MVMEDGGNVVWLFGEPPVSDDAALPLCGSRLPWERRMRDDLCTVRDLRDALESREALADLFGLVELDDELEAGLCEALSAAVSANDGGVATVPGMVVLAIRRLLWALPQYVGYVHPACGEFFR
jgi:hypothetical protein